MKLKKIALTALGPNSEPKLALLVVVGVILLGIGISGLLITTFLDAGDYQQFRSHSIFLVLWGVTTLLWSLDTAHASDVFDSLRRITPEEVAYKALLETQNELVSLFREQDELLLRRKRVRNQGEEIGTEDRERIELLEDEIKVAKNKFWRLCNALCVAEFPFAQKIERVSDVPAVDPHDRPTEA